MAGKSKKRIASLVGYAPSGRSKCKSCGKLIPFEELRFGDREKSDFYDGYIDTWFCSSCYLRKRKERAVRLRDVWGFDLLRPSTREDLLSRLHESDHLDCGDVEKLSRSWSFRQNFNVLRDSEMRRLLSMNHQAIPQGRAALLRLVASCMECGAIECCPTCGGAVGLDPYFDGFICVAESEWSSCKWSSKEVERRPFVVHSSFRQVHPFKMLSGPSAQKSEILNFRFGDSADVASLNTGEGEKASLDTGEEKPRFRRAPVELDGRLVSQNDRRFDALCALTTKGVPAVSRMFRKSAPYADPSTQHCVEWDGRIYRAILSLTNIGKDQNSFYFIQVLEGNSCNRWWLHRVYGRVGHGRAQMHEFERASDALMEFERIYFMKTHNDFASVRPARKFPGLYFPVDIADDGEGPATAEDPSPSLQNGAESAIDSCGGNVLSWLHPAVRNLLELIFDAKRMEIAMLEMKIDLRKMPLGKIAEPTVRRAFATLRDIEHTLADDTLSASRKEHAILEQSSAFYTLVPHDFGDQKVPMIDSRSLLAEKLQHLEALLNLSIAGKLLAIPEKDPTSRLAALKTQILPINPASVEFSVLYSFLHNTENVTRTDIADASYVLHLRQAFAIQRQEEPQRFAEWGGARRLLLWHGSRLTNFVGILAGGLRIAPPEAPSSGWRFGKGLYFGDLSAKCVEYCGVPLSRQPGDSSKKILLVLLAEVAVGDAQLADGPTHHSGLLRGKHSLLARGHWGADESQSPVVDEFGVEVQISKPVRTSGAVAEDLDMNEFIVYSPEQVMLRYLLKIELEYM